MKNTVIGWVLLVLLVCTFIGRQHSVTARESSIHRQHYSLRHHHHRVSAIIPEKKSSPPDTEEPSSPEECGATNKPYAAIVASESSRDYETTTTEKEKLICVDRAMIEDMRTRGTRFHLTSEAGDRTIFERLRALQPGDAPGGVMGLYHDYDEMSAFLRAMQSNHPGLVRLYSLGETLGHREILAVQLTGEPDIIHPGRPRVKFVANIHGNEAVGRELLLHFIQDLTTRYSHRERRVLALLDTTEVWIVPSINPDGFETGTRTNVADRDLNRDYPDQYTGSPRCIQPETRAIMEWSLRGPGSPFSLSLALHGGELVVNYPLDGNADFHSGQPSVSQDDAEFRSLSLGYASENPDIANNRRFEHGITNGAKWYVLNGGSQDWNYLEAGCMELTAEVSHRKFPNDTTLVSYWEKNREALLHFAEEIHHHGVWGYVLDMESGRPVRGARVYVAERPRGAHSPVDKYYAAYWRYLLEGQYTLVASAEGYMSETKVVKVPRLGTRRIDFMIARQQEHSEKFTKRRGTGKGSIPPVC